MPWGSLGVAAAALGLAALPALSQAFVLAPETVARAPWTLLTAHLVHHDRGHLLLDVVGFLAVAAPLERLAPRRWAATLLVAALAVGAAVTATIDGVYGGLSGLASAATVGLALTLLDRPERVDRGLGAALGLAFVGKLLLETHAGDALLAGGGEVVHLPLAHLVGALAGAAVALAQPSSSRSGQAGRRGPRRGRAEARTS